MSSDQNDKALDSSQEEIIQRKPKSKHKAKQPPHRGKLYESPSPPPPTPLPDDLTPQPRSTPAPIDYAKRYQTKPGQPRNPGGRAYTAIDRIAVLPTIHTPPSLDQPAPETAKSDLIDSWLEMAKREHASIASFALFSQKLMAVGAPLEFLTEALQCAQEEVRHARLCFEVASVLSGGAVEEARKEMEVSYASHRFEVEGDVMKVFEETLSLGCVMETLGALDAARKADLLGSGMLCGVWKEIAVDEAHHCEFGWKVVDWVIRKEGEGLREVLRGALRREVEGKRGEWPEEDLEFVLELGESLVERKEYGVGHHESLHGALMQRIRKFVLSL